MEGAISSSWREYFQRSDGDIFEIIEKAIMVAASDFPSVFKLARDGISELLHSAGAGNQNTPTVRDDLLVVEEVLIIKRFLDNYKQVHSSHLLFAYLERLRDMNLSIRILEITGIGKSVNFLRKCGFEEVRSISKQLIDEWKRKLASWLKEKETKPESKTRSEESEISVELKVGSIPADELKRKRSAAEESGSQYHKYCTIGDCYEGEWIHTSSDYFN